MSFNLSGLLPPGADNITSTLIHHATQALLQLFAPNTTTSTSADPAAPDSHIGNILASVTDSISSRTALENTSILLAFTTFFFLLVSRLVANGKMSWTSRFGQGLGRFSPFTRSPTNANGGVVTEDDFSYITADDLRKHGTNIPPAGSLRQQDVYNDRDAAMRETDAVVLRNKKKDSTVHFPAGSISKGQLSVGALRDAAARAFGTSDPRRIKMLYKGKNLKDDKRSCASEGLRHQSELLCTVADVGSADASDDDEDDEDDGMDGSREDIRGEGEGRRRRNRGKKTKRWNKREAQTQDSSGTSTPVTSDYIGNLHAPAPASQHQSRAPSPKPPQTPIEKIRALRAKLQEYMPQVDDFLRHPPSDSAKREFDYKRLSETILAQVLLKLDGVETEGDDTARAKRKELVKETQSVLNELDAMMKK